MWHTRLNPGCSPPAREGESNPFSLQVWDAIEGTLRSSNEEGQSGITALVFLNNR